MSQDIKSHITGLVQAALNAVAPDAADTPIALERPKQEAHGDFACNVAMQLARALKRNPREIAQALVAALPASASVSKVEIAGAGFINFHVNQGAKMSVVARVLAEGEAYGRGAAKPGKVQVEFVSANPTGPLHVGHGRGAAYGASLASVLAFAGYDVAREYYVNDAGRQMDILAVSTWLRYLDSYGVAIPFPPNCYQGDYVKTMAGQLRETHGERYVREAAAVLAGAPDVAEDKEAHLDAIIANAKDLLCDDYATVHAHVLAEQLSDGREDLGEYGVHFDVWFSEKSLYDTGLVARAVAELEARGHLYEQDGAKWFRSTAFGDEKDRVVQRENGIFTYFASDIAYHWNKIERGFTRIVDIWGADHHGYIPRVRGALKALGLDDSLLEVPLVQFVTLYRNGEKASMSTRSGEYVTLRDLRKEVGNDACRFFYLLRGCDQPLDFDLDLAKSQSNDNPVYYVQYAHARVCSVLQQWGGDVATLAGADLALLDNPREQALANRLAAFPEVVEGAARDLAPHKIAFYLKDLAADFHSYYNAERMLVDDAALKLARLALAAAVRRVIASGLAMLGVTAPTHM